MNAASTQFAARCALLALAGIAWNTAAAEIVQPLFADQQPLQIVIEAPISELTRRNTENNEVAGVLRYRNALNTEVELSVTLRPRGKSRLQYCDFPPLRLNLKRKQVPGTLFAEQNKLKLVTHCKRGAKHAAWVRQEYLIYRMYNILTEQSLRVRWLDIDYRDSAAGDKATAAVGFLLESAGNLAGRLSMQPLKQQEIDLEQLDTSQAALVSLFQFMIGNTDWSILSGAEGSNCCHNGEPLVAYGTTDGTIVVPYDFDQSGLIDTDYAIPSPSLRIDSVRQRRFRGFCMHNDQLPTTIAHFNAHRAAIDEVIDSSELARGTRNKMGRYVNGFYQIINNPQRRDRLMTDRCRGPA